MNMQWLEELTQQQEEFVKAGVEWQIIKVILRRREYELPQQEAKNIRQDKQG